MLKQGPMMPTVYVETTDSRLHPQTIVRITWDEERIERKCFATLAEALEFAQSLCDTSDDDGVASA